MTEITLFCSTFVLVFALGLQSLNVNNGPIAQAHAHTTGHSKMWK